LVTISNFSLQTSQDLKNHDYNNIIIYLKKKKHDDFLKTVTIINCNYSLKKIQVLFLNII